MLTPSPTSESDEFTMLTPLEPISDVPERFTVPVLFSVTAELFAAIAEFSSPAAVTLSIWLSRSGCLVLELLWPYAAPPTRTEAVTIVQRILFISVS
jgi:hypothetical protein